MAARGLAARAQRGRSGAGRQRRLLRTPLAAARRLLPQPAAGMPRTPYAMTPAPLNHDCTTVLKIDISVVTTILYPDKKKRQDRFVSLYFS